MNPVRFAVVLVTALLLHGCSADIQDGVGPRVPLPNVFGTVTRGGAPAADLELELRTVPDAHTIQTTTSADDGTYAFEVPEGIWEIKVEGERSDDFDSATREFAVVAGAGQVSVPGLDVHAAGAEPYMPAMGAALPRPTPEEPLAFHWTPPSRPFDSARVQVFGSDGNAVFYSAESGDSTASWDGTGNQGPFSGVVVPAGSYTWRVKFEMTGDMEARTWNRSLILE
jgi:hypothetical protein